METMNSTRTQGKVARHESRGRDSEVSYLLLGQTKRQPCGLNYSLQSGSQLRKKYDCGMGSREKCAWTRGMSIMLKGV